MLCHGQVNVIKHFRGELLSAVLSYQREDYRFYYDGYRTGRQAGTVINRIDTHINIGTSSIK